MSDILRQVTREAQRLHAYGFDVGRLCYVVDEQEWDALKESLNAIRGIHGPATIDVPGPTYAITISGLEVRSRRSQRA